MHFLCATVLWLCVFVFVFFSLLEKPRRNLQAASATGKGLLDFSFFFFLRAEKAGRYFLCQQLIVLQNKTNKKKKTNSQEQKK